MTLAQYLDKYGTHGLTLMGNRVLDRLLLGEGANEYNKRLAAEFKIMLSDLAEALEV